MFAGYLADKEFVDQVAQMNLDRELFTFQVVTAAMKNQFPDQADLIMHDFVRLLGFDAVVGNNDRHFFNWGVITQISGDRPPRFSPIFDTARALCWNIDEAGLEKAERNFETFLRKYAEGCYPKTGWDGLKSPNHFEIMRKIVSEHIEYWDTLGKLAIEKLPELVQELLDNEFEGLMSERRKRFIVACLERRMHYFIKAITI